MDLQKRFAQFVMKTVFDHSFSERIVNRSYFFFQKNKKDCFFTVTFK